MKSVTVFKLLKNKLVASKMQFRKSITRVATVLISLRSSVMQPFLFIYLIIYFIYLFANLVTNIHTYCNLCAFAPKHPLNHPCALSLIYHAILDETIYCTRVNVTLK